MFYDSRFRHSRLLFCLAVCVLPELTAATVCMAQVNQADEGREQARRAAVEAAQGQVTQAQTLLTAARTRVQATWKANTKLQDANKAVTEARKDLEAAKSKVVEKLKNDPAYVDAEKQEADERVDVKTEQEKTDSTQPATIQPEGAKEPGPNLPAPSAGQVDAAADKLRTSTKMRDMEEKAVSEDPVASKAEAKLNAAEQVAKAWQLQFDATLQNDPGYQSAVQQLAAAHARVSSAAAATY